MQTVPFNDLSRIHNQFIDNSINNFKEVIKNSSFVLNEYINQFEIDFAKFTNQKYTISCANGTDAIELILRALEIGYGDEVLLPANSFVATSIAVSRCGATPVFVDNDEFYLIDINDLKENISRKTKAIIAVNLYGQMADLKSLSKIAKENGIFLIEDAAQSHGAYDVDNKNVGDYSSAAAYSFYPGKNLGAWGDGGAVTTNNKKLAEKIKALRSYGSEKKYYHKYLGFNSRLQPFQGYVLSQKLKFLSDWNEDRNEIANIYSDRLSSYKNIILPKVFNGNSHVWHLYVVRVKNRNTIIDQGKKNGVEFSIHYPLPIHKQKAYTNHFQSKKLIKNADTYSKNLLSLPIFPKMKKTEVEKVLQTLINLAK
jgi:dTDP-4-amino-4,6-dideoxygalactose transaminase